MLNTILELIDLVWEFLDEYDLPFVPDYPEPKM